MRFGRPLGALITVGLILVGCLGKTTDSPAPIDILSPGKWTSLAPMPTARQEVAVAELNGRVFVIGGFGPGGEGGAPLEGYDPAAGRWGARAPPPPAAPPPPPARAGGRPSRGGGPGRGRRGRAAAGARPPRRAGGAARRPPGEPASTSSAVRRRSASSARPRCTRSPAPAGSPRSRCARPATVSAPRASVTGSTCRAAQRSPATPPPT